VKFVTETPEPFMGGKDGKDNPWLAAAGGGGGCCVVS
jgi:hypothetical protein